MPFTESFGNKLNWIRRFVKRKNYFKKKILFQRRVAWKQPYFGALLYMKNWKGRVIWSYFEKGRSVLKEPALLKWFIEKILINTEESYQTGFEKKEKFIRARWKEQIVCKEELDRKGWVLVWFKKNISILTNRRSHIQEDNPQWLRRHVNASKVNRIKSTALGRICMYMCTYADHSSAKRIIMSPWWGTRTFRKSRSRGGASIYIWPISMYILLSCFSKNCSDHFSGLVKANCRTGNIYPSHGPGVRHNKAVHGCLASITSGWAQGGIKAVGVWWTKNPAITVKGKPTLSSPSKWETTSTRGPVRSDIPSCHSPSKSAGMYWIFCWNQSTSHAPTSVDEHLLGGGPQIRGSVRTWNSSPGSRPAAGSGSPRALPQHFLLGNTGSLHLNH